MTERRKHPRMVREEATIEAMLRMYCCDHHGNDAVLCADCSDLLAYARLRLDQCPFQEGKTTCGNCSVHCYKPSMREKVRAVMRYSGPRMAGKHPVLAVRHLLDGLRKKPGPRKDRKPRP